MKRKESDGHSYPAMAYAYAPNKRDPSSWRLRLWADGTGLSESLVVEAMSTPLVDIAEADRPAVAEKIASAWQKLQAEASIPLVEFAPLDSTPEVRDEGRVATVVIIKPGFNSDKSRYYPKETLAECAHLFEGAKMYRDHDTQRQRRERPVGSIDRWAGVLKNVRVREDDGALIGDAHIVDASLRTKMSDLKAAGLLQELGVSLRALGKGVRHKVEGVATMLVEAFQKVLSVDFVTEAGAQGMVLAFESVSNLDSLDLDTLREQRPDLFESVRVKHGDDNMDIEELTRKLREATERITVLESAQRDQEGTLAAVTRDRDAYKARVEEAEEAEAIAETQTQVAAMLKLSKLPEPARDRVAEAFEESATFDAAEVTQAIEDERTYLASLQEAGTVRGLGPSGGYGEDDEGGEADGEDELRETMEESYRRQGHDPEEAERMATLALGV